MTPRADPLLDEARREEMIALLHKSALFADLTDEMRAQLARACRHRIFRGKAHLFHQGDTGSQLYLVMRGGVRIYSRNEEAGQETTLALLSEGDAFGEIALLTGCRRTASAVLISETTELLILDRESFHEALHQSADMAIILLQSLALRLKQTSENLVSLTSNSSLSRVAKLLLARADVSGKLTPRLSQAEIASLVGVRRETVARNLARMEEVNCLIRNRGRILITDRTRLERLARMS